MSIEIFNVIVCLSLMSMCCEGKSEIAELKCQKEIMNVATANRLYRSSGKMWPFKGALISYVANVYLDSGNPDLFDVSNGPTLVSLKKLIEQVARDMELIQEEWHQLELNCVLLHPDGTQSTFREDAQKFAFL